MQPKGVALPSFVTSNDDFYRIDTALTVPQLSRADWQLRIHGMVDREITYRFEDLDRFEVVEKVVTLTCVSNPVGGDLISNATWTGYRVRDLLADAGVHADADMVLSTSSDGFTAGTPVEALTDGRDALLAVGMNGEPLPTKHGYPARLVVPGLYGYVSATKWVVDLELTRFDQAEAYWTKLGWSPRGPIKTESRIDVPRSGEDVARGPVTFGGVAWAQNRGVKAVEVRIDDGPWQQASWARPTPTTPGGCGASRGRPTDSGSHTITVRATDNTGATQTEQWADPVPDGASGWHSVYFAVHDRIRNRSAELSSRSRVRLAAQACLPAVRDSGAQSFCADLLLAARKERDSVAGLGPPLGARARSTTPRRLTPSLSMRGGAEPSRVPSRASAPPRWRAGICPTSRSVTCCGPRSRSGASPRPTSPRAAIPSVPRRCGPR